MKFKILAPAKLNLYLEVLSKRQHGEHYGYHELESHAVFLELADELSFESAETIELIGSEIDDNIVLKTARKLQEFSGYTQGARITLSKHIPQAAGLGGGSADAAATIIGLQKLWDFKSTQADLYAIAKQLGADVPACLYSLLENKNSVQFSGIGEKLSPIEAPKNLNFVLVNPLKHLSTADVFRNIEGYSPAGSSINFLERRNDLQAPAQKLMPEITEILSAIAEQKNCELSRMTGSGATCFGVFTNAADAQTAADNLKTRFPNYFVEYTSLK